MSVARRILDAVTPRRVAAVLLIGGFADGILSFLRWLALVGWDLKDVATLRGCLLAGARFAVEIGLIYLAVGALRSVVERRRRGWATIASAAAEDNTPASFEGGNATGTEAAAWPREGGRDGGPDHD